MKKKVIVIFIIIVILVITNFIVSRNEELNTLKENMTDVVNDLMNDISQFNYDGMKKSLKKSDGSELSNQEILNFLYNTNLYRATLLHDQKKIFNINPNVNYFNTSSGTAILSFTALDGDEISNQFKYIDNDGQGYIIADELQETNKEIVSYTMFTDLANGDYIEIDESNKNDIIPYEVPFINIHKTQDNMATYEIFNEVTTDLYLNALDILYETKDDLKNINENYDIQWNDDFTEFSLYYDKNSSFMMLRTICFSSVEYLQVFRGFSDWHLKIHYYDYETKELIGTETIR